MTGLAQPGIADKLAVDVPGIARDCGSIGGSIAAAAGSAGQNATLTRLSGQHGSFRIGRQPDCSVVGKTATAGRRPDCFRMESGFRCWISRQATLAIFNPQEGRLPVWRRAFCLSGRKPSDRKDVGEAIAARNPISDRSCRRGTDSEPDKHRQQRSSTGNVREPGPECREGRIRPQLPGIWMPWWFSGPKCLFPTGQVQDRSVPSFWTYGNLFC